MADEFPAEVKQFIERYIESLPQLETLLLLREDQQRQWSPSAIAKVLYIPPELAQSLLEELSRRGFATLVSPAETHYAYHSADAAADGLVDQLATVYQERRVAVISMIYSKPLNKVQTFADAFRLRKEDPQ